MSTPDVDAILASLTQTEKITLLAGKDFWVTHAIPEKGVPPLKLSDGPNGARGAAFEGGPTAACFPSGSCLAASWDEDLVRRVGNALARETLSKGAGVVLGPTVCPHRSPLGGRNFESFSEDPLLAGVLATAYINGVQEKGVGVAIKHFACNEQETDRAEVDVRVSERALREIYLKPFEIAAKQAKPWAVMTSYNRLNGVHADMNPWLFKVLREEWGWDGLVMSDWGGTNSTISSLKAGLDLEMPGPSVWRTIPKIEAAIGNGQLSEEVLDARCRNLLNLLVKTKMFESSRIPEEKAIDYPEDRALIREAGAKGMVLLKNEDDILPLKKEELRGKTIAVVGLAKEALAHGGGSASVSSHYKISPWKALTEVFQKGDGVTLKYGEGAHMYRELPPLTATSNDHGTVTHTSPETGHTDTPGFLLERFPTADFTGTPDLSFSHNTSGFKTIFNPLTFNHVRFSTIFTPSESGSHYLAFSSMGSGSLLINGEIVVDQPIESEDQISFLLGGVDQKIIQYKFIAGQPYKIEIQSHSHSPEASVLAADAADAKTLKAEDEGEDIGGPLSGLGGVRLLGFTLGFMTESSHDADLLSEAVELAQDPDCALVLAFTGHTPAWETEGQDQVSFSLPRDGSQDALVTSVAKVNPNVVVINTTGVAVSMGRWIDKVKAVLHSGFPGQEVGHSIVDVLTGKCEPGGRLPFSWPRQLEDTWCFGNFPGEIEKVVVGKDAKKKTIDRRVVQYAEDVFMGYKHYDRLMSTSSGKSELFPFGFGLGYSSYKLDSWSVKLGSAVDGANSQDNNKSIEISVGVSSCDQKSSSGSLLIQIYAGPVAASESHQNTEMPIKILVDFKKVYPGGESTGRTTKFSVPIKRFAYWSEERSCWRLERGQYSIWIGQNVRDAELAGSVNIEDPSDFGA